MDETQKTANRRAIVYGLLIPLLQRAVAASVTDDLIGTASTPMGGVPPALESPHLAPS
jgi:hypothetical protein